MYKDVITNICTGLTGKTTGSIECRAMIGESEPGGQGWTILSGLSFMTLYLMGVPLWSHKSELQIEVMIFNTDNDLVGQYISDVHKSKAYHALYWGYNDPGRQTARDTFTACMKDIKRMIASDYDRLNEALKQE